MDREIRERIIELNKRLGLRTEFIEDEEVLGYSIGRTIYINVGIEQEYEKTNKHEILHYYEETEEFKKIKEQVLEENEENLEEIRREYELRYYGLYSEEEIKAGVLENEIVIDMLIENSVIEYNRGLEIGEVLLGEIERGLEEKRYLTISLRNNIRNMNLSKWEKIFVQNYYDGKERKLPPKEGREESIKKEIEDRLQELYSMTEEDFKIDPHSPEIIREYRSEIKVLKQRGENTSSLEENKEKALEELSKRFSKQLWEEYKHIVDFIKGEEYEPAFKYLMLKETLTKIYRKDKIEEKVEKLGQKRDLRKSISGHMILNKTTLDMIYQDVEDGKNFANIYFRALEMFNKIISEKNSVTIEGIETYNKGKWLRFEGKKSNKKEYLKNAERLASLVADTPWCTKKLASSQLAEGDFFVFVDNEEKPHIAVKMNGQEIDEVRGIKNGNAQELEEEYRDVALSFLEENKEIKNGKEWLEKEEWNKRLIEYNKKIEEGTFTVNDVEGLIQDIFYHKDYKNHGEDENSNKTELKKKLNNIKGILAEYYGIDENEIYCGDVDFNLDFQDEKPKKCPYKVILGGAKFGNSKITDLGNLQEILGDADFKNSMVESLGDLQRILGDAKFGNSKITDLGNLQEILGDADFENSMIESLGDLQRILGDAKFGNSKITDLGNLQEILGDADFKNSIVESLGNLQKIGGNTEFSDSQVTDLGNLQEIEGNAYFAYSKITNLGNLQRIGKSAYFCNSQIIDLGDLQTIGNCAYFSDSQVTDLGNLQEIGGDAEFHYSQITNLGNLKKIGRNAEFKDSQVTDLGNLKEIGRDANFRGSKIMSLGKLERIGRHARFEYSQVADLRNLQEIGGDANFRKSKIMSLRKLERIGGDAEFSDSQVTDLGNLKEIGGDANFRGSKIMSLEKLERIGKDAIFEDSQVTDLGNLQDIGGNANFRGTKIMSLGKLKRIRGNSRFEDSLVIDLGNLRKTSRKKIKLDEKAEWNKRLAEYIKKINEKSFSKEDVEDLIHDLFVRNYGNYENLYRLELQKRLSEIKGIIAEHYGIDENEIYCGNLSFLNETDYTECPYRMILGDADFKYSGIRDLGKLQLIGGNAFFSDSSITSLKNLKIIGGDADFRRSRIKSLENLQSIGGNANFSNSMITDLGSLQRIGGDANFRRSRIKSLKNITLIGGNVDFGLSSINDLGNLISINGRINWEYDEWDYNEKLKEQYKERAKARKEMEEIVKIAQGVKTSDFLYFMSEITESVKSKKEKQNNRRDE